MISVGMLQGMQLEKYIVVQHTHTEDIVTEPTHT